MLTTSFPLSSVDNSSAITTPAAQSPEDEDENSGALIGGIVGVVIVLLLVGALIAFWVVRSRRQPKDKDVSADNPPESNYGRIPPARSNYDVVAIAPKAENSHYEVLNADEL